MSSPFPTACRTRKPPGSAPLFRPRDLEPLDVPFAELQKAVTAGAVEKVRGPASARLARTEPNEFETLAMVASAAPKAIICLLSALSVHAA